MSRPESFRDYVAGSLAEFSCAKGGYVGTAAGWFCDRSACYLAVLDAFAARTIAARMAELYARVAR
ncbi:MAG TPA: hypothetical protein VGX45_04040 [Solirubrobacteraceae bacterium]|nr:hypothetical protein [Solirubrobacteraceae bacterium]